MTEARVVDMTDGERDAAADAHTDVVAAQRESAERHRREHEPPPGSWRAKMRDYEAEFVSIYWDGKEWEIPAKMPNAFFEARSSGDARTMMESILGLEGMRELRIPLDIDAEMLADMAVDLAETATEAWAVPNLSRSARRLRGTTRR